MLKGITSNGYQYEVDERKFSSWDFAEMIALYNKASRDDEDDGTSVEVVVDMAKFLFGEEEMKKIKQLIASQNDGIADFNAITKMLFEIMSSAGVEVKN